jgi:hypothetical protein
LGQLGEVASPIASPGAAVVRSSHDGSRRSSISGAGGLTNP